MAAPLRVAGKEGGKQFAHCKYQTNDTNRAHTKARSQKQSAYASIRGFLHRRKINPAMRLNIPTWLTFARVLAIPLLFIFFYLPGSAGSILSTFLFILAAFTDWLDGYLARRWEQTSAFGAFLDPVADKVLVAVALVLLLQADPQPLIALAVAVIISREITISALREWMAEIGQRASVAVTRVAKAKTMLQMVAITLMLWQHDIVGFPTYTVGVALLVIAALLTLWTMVKYLKVAWPILRDGLP